MVRLKAIKNLDATLKETEFQFLMVRLKGITAGTDFRGITAFQFLMVRLKGNWLSHPRLTWPISIPYGSIKSVQAERAETAENDFNSLWFD